LTPPLKGTLFVSGRLVDGSGGALPGRIVTTEAAKVEGGKMQVVMTSKVPGRAQADSRGRFLIPVREGYWSGDRVAFAIHVAKPIGRWDGSMTTHYYGGTLWTRMFEADKGCGFLDIAWISGGPITVVEK
jgi:hypothetical protein